MPATVTSYIVVSSLPVVVEDEVGKTTSYNPGAIFQALDNNPSVVRLQAIQHIIPFIGQPVAGQFVVSEGPAGPTGPAGPAGAGETNTNTNAGGDVGLALAKVGVDTPLRGLTAGTNITLMTTKTQGNEESLFVLDGQSHRLLIYHLDLSRKRIELSASEDLRKMFAEKGVGPRGR